MGCVSYAVKEVNKILYWGLPRPPYVSLAIIPIDEMEELGKVKRRARLEEIRRMRCPNGSYIGGLADRCGGITTYLKTSKETCR